MADNGSSPTNVAAKRPRKRPSKAAVKAAMRTASDIVEDNPEVLDEVLDQVGATINARSNGGGLAEPEADELGDELIFVRNGWVRCVIAGQMFKLRRPFFGELRDLETSQEADQTQLTPPGNTPPTDVPSWVVDPQMQNRIIAHWRSVPLASGSG